MREWRKLYLSLQLPLVRNAWVEAEGWHNWADKALNDDPGCHICGRREEFLFDFARLIFVCDGEKVVRECRWHGPKVIVDCRTGEEISIPEPPQWPRVQRFVEGLVLYSAIVVRFCWFFLVAARWRLVISNDVTFAIAVWLHKRRCNRLTKEEFEAFYAAGSKVSIERLRELGLVAAPCDCGEEGCRGWRMDVHPSTSEETDDGQFSTWLHREYPEKYK